MKAILPGAFQGSVIGSLLVAVYFTYAHAADGGGFSLTEGVGVVMLFCFVMMVATMAGMIVCAIYIAVVGLPLALLMRRRIATQAMLIVTLLVAITTGLASSHLLLGPIWAGEFSPLVVTALTLSYAIPAALAYRRAIITERLLSFWSTDSD